MEPVKSFDVTDNFMAGASDSGIPNEVPVNLDTAVEIAPMTFDKDLMDFRPTPVDDEGKVIEDYGVPKGRSAQALASEQKSMSPMPLGLEDVSVGDPELPLNLPTTATPPAV